MDRGKTSLSDRWSPDSGWYLGRVQVRWVGAVISQALRYPFAILLGAGFFLLAIAISPGLMELGASTYDRINPIASDWIVTDSRNDGDDVVLSGHMLKHRNCVFVPPTIARDSAGQNYPVVSGSATAGKTWAASGQPQRFGPWRVVGGANKKLTFVNVYICGEGRPSILTLGIHGKDR